MIFTIRTNKDFEVFDFLNQSRKRFNEEGSHKVFISFFDFFLHNSAKGVNYYGVKVVVGLPPVFLIGLIPLALFIIFHIGFFLILGSLFLFSGYFWTPIFFKAVLKAGLRRKGYKGEVILVKNNEFINQYFYGGD